MTREDSAPGKRLYSPELVAEATELCYITAYELGLPEPGDSEPFAARWLHDYGRREPDEDPPETS